MSENVELSTLDLRYEGHRLRDDAREARLLASIAQRGIEEPLEGVDTPAGRFLLNGFKRYRCAKKLGVDGVPYSSLGQEEATGIVNLMRVSSDKALGILEQARFIVDLVTIHGLSVAEVAETLTRSKAWVSMRRSLLDEMSPAIQQILFRGAFPVYCYMYTLRQFMRMNSVTKDEIERFMKAVAGKRLSVRDIELLARGYFQGPVSLREAIDGGKNARFSPEGQPTPRHLPKHRKHGSEQEEKRLRALGPVVADYVDYVIQTPGIQRHRFVRELFALSQQVTATVFVQAIERALRYRVVHLETLQRIAWFCMSQGEQRLPYADIDENFRERPAYQEGCLTDEPDLRIYDQTPAQEDETDPPESEDDDG